MRLQKPVAVLVAFLAVCAACGNGDAEQEVDRGSRAEPSSTAAAGGLGPREIPATIVDLEVDAFPRPADEACLDNTTVVEVAVGESIAAALEVTEPGTTIAVSAGTYVEHPGEWVALEADTDDLCLRAVGGEVVLEAASDQRRGISLTGDDMVIDGLVLRGFETGIAVDGRDRETQRALTIEDTRIEELVGEFREGIVVFAEPSDPVTAVLDGLLLLGVEVEGTDLGVSCNVGPCEHVWVERTRIAGRAGSGDSGADALAIEEGRQIVVVDSVVEGAPADGIDTKASDVVVLGCQLFDLGRNGVKLWRGGDVINTIIDGSGADASIVGEEPGRYRYLHTLVAHHGDPGETPFVGTWSYDTPSTEITIEIVNSIFYQNSPGGFFVPDGAAVSIRNSIFHGAPGDTMLDVGQGASYTLADLDELEDAGFGVGNVVADPGLVDPAGRDFSTDASSPARDAGEEIDGLDTDATGSDRVRGTAPDIGPVES